VVAEQAVDLAVNKLSLKTRQCQTHIQPVKGGKIAAFRPFINQAGKDVMDREIIEHLVHSYGSEYCRLEQLSLTRLDPDFAVTEAEVIHAFREEMALTLLDVIQRRTELGAAGMPSMPTLQKCSELMAHELGWNLKRQRHEIDTVMQAYPLEQMERIEA
jgi:glycerol-3-phosphate dehydrogenase